MSISFINRKSGGGGGDGSSLNIFTQLAEPATKKGLWLQTDKIFEHIYGDDDVVESESWYPDGTYRNIPYNFSQGSAAVFGTDIYLFGGNNGVSYLSSAYKYDTLTNTYTQLANIPYSFNNNAVLICNKAFLLGGSSYPTKVQCMQIESKEYEDNSVVISQGRLYNVGYATEIFSNNLASAPLLYALADAWFYTTQDGLITNIPTYYGDGTQWLNIKNPPSIQSE